VRKIAELKRLIYTLLHTICGSSTRVQGVILWTIFLQTKMLTEGVQQEHSQTGSARFDAHNALSVVSSLLFIKY